MLRSGTCFEDSRENVIFKVYLNYQFQCTQHNDQSHWRQRTKVNQKTPFIKHLIAFTGVIIENIHVAKKFNLNDFKDQAVMLFFNICYLVGIERV